MVTLIEEEWVDKGNEVKPTKKYVEDKEVEDITYADIGESLVNQRSLSSVHEDCDEWLRTNIFQTRCTSHGKVCDIIIDGGSYENVVAEDMVKKLKLKT